MSAVIDWGYHSEKGGKKKKDVNSRGKYIFAKDKESKVDRRKRVGG